jgi:class 3 adenylate cyclase
MSGLAARGDQHSLTLGFIDPKLEKQYQLAAGRESINGFRTIALASGVVWLVAALLLPTSTNLEPAFGIAVPLAMAATGFGVALLAPWAQTLDRQHALVMVLTSANGIVILALALISGLLPGYGVAATMLLFAWGFVSRTRFIYAALRTTVIAVGFIIAVELYTGPYNMALDVFFFAAGAVGTLLALRILERNRRRLFFQDLVIHEQTQQLQEESAKSERLILNILPASIAERLRNGEVSIADEYPLVSVLFADIVGFTPLAARLKPRELVDMLSGLFSAFDDLVAERGLEKIKTIGDSYMAVGGLTGDAREQAVNTVSLGLAMIEEANKRPFLGQPVQFRIGVHSGPIVGGVIGTRKLAFDLWGDTVNIASRLEGVSKPGRVLVSEATWMLVRDEFHCEAESDSMLRGHSTMRTYSIIGPLTSNPAVSTSTARTR